MEIDGKMNIVSIEIDPSTELNLTNSLESGITSESSRSDADSKLDECSGWTNEKHNAYLDYLENSFVKQLYSFIGGGETRRLSRDFSGTYLRNSVGHECLAQTTAEASGQNFEEEEEEEKRFDSEVTRKREREPSNDGSSLKDQVVPVRTVKPRM